MDRYSTLDAYMDLMQGGYEYTDIYKDLASIIDKICSKSNFLKMNQRARIERALETIDDGFEVIKRERQKLKDRKRSRLRDGIEAEGLFAHLMSWIPILNIVMFLSPNMRNLIRNGRLSVKDYDMLLDIYERRLKENKAYLNKRLQTTLKESFTRFATPNDYYEAVTESNVRYNDRDTSSTDNYYDEEEFF